MHRRALNICPNSAAVCPTQPEIKRVHLARSFSIKKLLCSLGILFEYVFERMPAGEFASRDAQNFAHARVRKQRACLAVNDPDTVFVFCRHKRLQMRGRFSRLMKKISSLESAAYATVCRTNLWKRRGGATASA